MKNFIKGSSVLALGDLITKLLSVLYLIPLNLIDPAIPAIMAMLLIPFAFAIVFTTLGINVILNVEFIKYYKKDASKLKQVLIAGIVILSAFSLFTITVMYGGAEAIMRQVVGPEWMTNEYYPYLVTSTKLLSVGTVLYAMGVYLRSLLTAFGEYKIISISYVTEQLLKVGLTLFLTYYLIVIKGMNVGVSAYVMSVSIVLSMLTTPLLYLWKLAKEGYLGIFKEGKHTFDKEIYKTILFASLVFFASSLYMSAFDQIDLMILPNLMSGDKLQAAQAEYFNLSMKFVMIPIQLSAAFISVMVREIQVEGRNKKLDLDNMLTIVMIYATVMMLGVWTVGPDAYNLMYGDATFYSISYQALIIPFYIIRNIISGYVVTNDGKVASILTSAVVILISKFVFDIIFFNIFGLAGFSYSSVLSLIISLSILVIPNRHLFLFNKNVLFEKTNIIVKTIIMFIVCVFLKNVLDGAIDIVFLRLIVKGIIVVAMAGLAYYPNFKRLKGQKN